MRSRVSLPLALVLAMFASRAVRADGGMLRTSKTVGARIVSAFTTPPPPCVGSIDVSVLLQEADSGRVVLDVPVTIRARHRLARTRETPATRAAATNQLMRAALLDLPVAGVWTIDIVLDGDETPITFDLSVGEPPPPWRDMLVWFLWPAAIIGLFLAAGFRKGQHPSSSRNPASRPPTQRRP